MNVADALAKIQAGDAQIAEHQVPVEQLIVEPGGISVGDRRFQFAAAGLESFCDRIARKPKIPAGYLGTLPTRFQTALIRYHLGEGFQGGGTASLITRGSEVVGFGRADLARMSGREVLEAVVEGISGQEGDLKITRLATQGESLHFELITYRSEQQVRRGDIVYGGVHVDHSLTGDFATRVEGFLYRLACTNGAVQRECLGPRERSRTRRLPADHPQAKARQREQIRRLTAGALDTVSKRLPGLEQLATEQVDFKHLAVNWLRRTRLSTHRLIPLLEQAYADERGEGTAFDALNAFTRVATHNTELSPTTRDVLARMGGLLALGHSRLCSKCWSLLAASN